VDSIEVASGISRAVGTNCDVGILIEVDTGLHRVGVSASEVGDLASAVNLLPGLHVVGAMTHEGHIGRYARSDPRIASELTARAVTEMRLARDELRALGVEDAIISMGSTSTLQFLLTHDDVDEVRPGLYVFLDMNSVSAGAGQLHDVAASLGRLAAESS
jgi:D-serine deaminase-like pyridoxal phosphate-dependent protein